MSLNPIGTKAQTQEVIPAILLYSTMALLPVILGLVFHDFLVFGEAGSANALLIVFLMINAFLCYFWAHLSNFTFKFCFLKILVALQWAFIAIKVSSLSSQLDVRGMVFEYTGFVIAFIFAFHFLGNIKGNTLIFPVVFGAFGISTMISLIWNGLGTWTMSAHALSLKESHVNFSSDDSKEFYGSKQNKFGTKNIKEQWKYSGETGPEMWSSLHDSFKTCSSGLEQSPIDIPKRTQTLKRDIKFEWNQESGVMINDGHTVQLNLNGKSKAQISGKSFILKNFHFHTPSEHQVAGMSYPMEVHFALESLDGKKAMIALFVDIGKSHDEYGKILAKLPESADGKLIEIGVLNLDSLLPKDTEAYRYKGSETIPPCSEDIMWSVLSETVELSTDQVNMFRKLIPFNARPIQPIGSRIFESSVVH